MNCTAFVFSFHFFEVILHARDRSKLAQEGVCVELSFVEVICILDRVVDVGDDRLESFRLCVSVYEIE